MSMEFAVQVDGKVFEISELVTKVSYNDVLNNGCGKLEFSYINDDLVIKNGSIIRFKFNNTDIFYGYVFKFSGDKGKEISATAYDQLRYCKAKDTIVVKNDTITTLASKMSNYFRLRKGHLTDTSYMLPISIHDDKTWLDIIYTSISDTLTNTGKWYALRDEFGGLSVRNLDELKLDLILGDDSLAYDYQYERSIDEDFYNQIKLAYGNESTGKIEVISKDNGSIATYGLLQYFEVSDKNTNASQAKSKADMLLKLYNREAESISLECLGDTRVRAGSSFYGQIDDIKLNKRLIVRSITHKYIPIHTMSIEVMA